MPKVGVVLSGCGFLDGAEIYEATLTLLCLDRRGISYQCLAPDVEQLHVVNHVTKEATSEKRNVLTEAARIARGRIEPLEIGWLDRLDAVIFPGGFGAAKNYCDFALKGAACKINPLVESFMRKAVERQLPIGAICIAPVVLARALKGLDMHPRLTVGALSDAARAIDEFGGRHVVCPVTECVVDHELNIVSTPAFMYDARISEVEQGVDKLVDQIAALINAICHSEVAQKLRVDQQH
ncbi:MAG: isoprenoid biosynthesis glyoxalase ElbB [Calditrichaeota bacterium]|nr:isoprenoid biosynthesis glyoxalase ElbB [Calditrichota bacterium]MCB9366255.1 isoprenoid biosynthesis glyoxalase ElbB [Calditrichota bacterium]MCB9391676.1 isoprenoid biosynthesis glyoxalase ElbB [Calditrichota bacterium]